ncbi:hypothetical protein ACQ4LE_001248 [Meloidogyne hapla]
MTFIKFKIIFLFLIISGIFIKSFEAIYCSKGNKTNFDSVLCKGGVCLTLLCDGDIHLRDCADGKLKKGGLCSTYSNCPKKDKAVIDCPVCSDKNNCNSYKN